LENEFEITLKFGVNSIIHYRPLVITVSAPNLFSFDIDHSIK